MRADPTHLWNRHPSADKEDGLTVRSDQPKLPEAIERITKHLRRLHHQDSYSLDKILLTARVLVIEGISGSGKDTFQTYLKNKLVDREVYDFSEGELLHSWKHVPIEGIFELRIQFIALFVNYLKDVVSRNENAVFLLNRFHLSTYVSTIIRQPELEKEYDKIIHVLRTLPVHVFILQLDKNEIEKRSLHSERSSVWQKFQQGRVKNDGFEDRSERFIWQQRLILEAAKRQRIPYTVIKFPPAPEIASEPVRVPEGRSANRPTVRLNAPEAKIARRKRDLPGRL